ncbi:hypothetical protein [Psychrobacillus sp. FSL H8-0510]|uniref:hypothetical protein n=1 Tax=Psychrobacillus sp. FSL H8-0510 TaxID=2921394 RepID=UPI0030F98FB3
MKSNEVNLGFSTDMDIYENSLIKKIELKLEESIGKEYYEYIKYRVLEKNPNLSDQMFESRWIEMKRFFLIKALVPEVTMFSEKVDDIWHEMLMYTKEYYRFSNSFIGEMIHHHPHIQGSIDHSARAWFDWIYLHLFKLKENSWELWNGFLLNKLNKQFIEFVDTNTNEIIIKKLFNVKLLMEYPESEDYYNKLIKKLKTN